MLRLIRFRLHSFTPFGVRRHPDRRPSARWFLGHTIAHLLVRGTGYDNANQLTGITYRDAASTLLGNLTYGYDVAGRRTSLGGSFARTGLPDAITSATYDANNRLTNWNATALSHDANGNLLGFGGNTYTWNKRDQLSAISGTNTASFQYDGVGRREAKTIAGTSTAFLYDGLNPIQEKSGSTITASILTGLGIDEFLARTEGASTQHFLTDALGSAIRLTDASAAKVVDYTYEPYGKSSADAASTNAFQYTGRENDATGLNYYRARYQHPVLGRFIAEDPIELEGGPNLYAYVAADPIGSTDPLGLIQIYEVDGVTFHAYPGPQAGGREHARHGAGESYHVHAKTADGREVRYSSETWKPLTLRDEMQETKQHKNAIKELTDGEKKLLDRINREVFHRGRPTIKQLERIGAARGGRAGVICRPSGGAQ